MVATLSNVIYRVSDLGAVVQKPEIRLSSSADSSERLSWLERRERNDYSLP